VATINENLHVAAALSCRTFTPPEGCISDLAVLANAGIDADKLEHIYRGGARQAGTAVDETRPAGIVVGAEGSLRAFKVSAITAPAGAATVTADLRVNGVSVLTGVVTLNNTHTARQVVSGTITTPDLEDGDMIEVVVNETTSGGTQATGLIAEATWSEDAQ
jgi:hypothetical protein